MTKHIPREFIGLLLDRINLVELIRTYLPLQKKSGSNYFGCCPFHNEKTPSFSVSETKQFYHCFGCGTHGNAIDFLMQHDHFSFPEAVESLARQAGMDIPYANDGQHKKEEDITAPLYALMTQATNFYQTQLRQSQKAIQYLKQRGLSGAIAQAFGLGYAPTAWSELLDALGKTAQEKKHMLSAGLIIQKTEGGYYDRFRDRIMFPIHDHRGRIIGFGGRILEQGEPKYLNSPETPLFQKGHELYGLYQALQASRKIEQLLIVEGYMDVIALVQHGITYAVATLGTATTPHHLQRLFRYTNTLIFCFDGDDAGRKAAWRALETLLPIVRDSVEIRFLFLPEAEDPDSLVRKEGKEAFEKRLENALTLSAFFLKALSQDSDFSSMEGRARFVTQALVHVKKLKADILQTLLVEEIAKKARVDSRELKQQVIGETLVPPTPVSKKVPPANKVASPLRIALALAIQYPELMEDLPELPSSLTLPGYHIMTQLIEIIKENKKITTGQILEYWRGQAEEKLVAKLAYLEHAIPEEGLRNELLGAIQRLTLLSYEQEIERLLNKASQQGLAEEEKQALADWIQKKKTFSNDIRFSQ